MSPETGLHRFSLWHPLFQQSRTRLVLPSLHPTGTPHLPDMHTSHTHAHMCTPHTCINIHACTYAHTAHMLICMYAPLSPSMCTYEHMLQPAYITPVTCMFVHMCGEVKVKATHFCLFVTPWTIACQAPLSMGFSRHEYWSGLPFPPSGDLPSPGIEHRSPVLQADSLPSEPPGKSHKRVPIR